MDNIISMVESDCATQGMVVSAALLRRLGDAALGFPDGRPRWFVCRMKPVNGQFSVSVHQTCAEADAARNKLSDPAAFAVFGPFVSETSEAIAMTPQAAVSPPDGADASAVKTPLASITLTFGDGKAPITIDAKSHDAIFWGRASVQKFVLPYYAAAVDLTCANAIAQEFGTADAFALVHEPDTEYRILKLGNEPL
jgi:hypothetical protein